MRPEKRLPLECLIPHRDGANPSRAGSGRPAGVKLPDPAGASSKLHSNHALSSREEGGGARRGIGWKVSLGTHPGLAGQAPAL